MKHLIYLCIIPISVLFGVSGVAASNKEMLKTFRAPDGAPVSDNRFSVRVRQENQPWQTLSVYAFLQQYTYLGATTSEPQFVNFDSDGEIILEIEVKEPLKSFRIKPSGLKIRAIQKDQKIQFRMNNMIRQVCIEVNGDPKKTLLLFRNPLERNAPDPNDLPKDMVYFGPGYHRISGDGAIHGKSVYLAGGAVVEGHLEFENDSNIHVWGSGIIYNPHEGSGGSSILHLSNCSKIILENIICVQRSEGWGIIPIACHDVQIKGLKLITEVRDGIDLLNSQNVHISNCFIMSHDDAICMKGIQGGKNQTVEDILVEHCIVANMGGGNGIEIGYESITSVYQRIKVQDVDIIYCLSKPNPHPEWPEAALSIHPTQMTEYNDPDYMGTMPPIRDVSYKNIRIESCEDRFYFDIFPNRNSPGKGIENILLENITITDSPERPSRILGRADHPIRNINFKNLKMNGTIILNAEDGNFEIQDADNVKFN
jgi:hypothetical protein